MHLEHEQAASNIEVDGEAANSARRELPPVVRIEPASVCNLRCTHCPTGVVKMARTIMSRDLFDRVLSEISRHIPPIRVAVLYHGGEPFLNKHFLDMARRVKDLGIERVKTVSNGMLIRAEMCDHVVRCGLTEIEISLDGESASENNRIRKRSNFERVARTVHRLVDSNIRQGRPLRISIATTQFKRYQDPGDEVPSVPEYLRVAFAGIETEIEFKPTWAMLWPSGEPRSGYDLILDDAPEEPPITCSLLDETFTIRADGQVVACCYDLTTMSNLGNISDTSIEDIWNGHLYSKFRGDR